MATHSITSSARTSSTVARVADRQAASSDLAEAGENRVKIPFGARLQHLDPDAEDATRRLRVGHNSSSRDRVRRVNEETDHRRSRDHLAQ